MTKSQSKRGPSRNKDGAREDPTERSDMSMVEVPLGASETKNTHSAEMFEEEEDGQPRRPFVRVCIGLAVLVTIVGIAVLVVLLSTNQHKPQACTKEARVCPDGTVVGRDGANNCEFSPCPLGSAEDQLSIQEANVECARETKMCTDFSYVTRTGPNCEFEPCPVGACMVASHECPDGSLVGLDPSNNCEPLPCPGADQQDLDNLLNGAPPVEIPPVEEPECVREMQLCTDGTTVIRSGPDCVFEPCPVGACLVDTQACSDGSTVGRDPENDCEYAACPDAGEVDECPRDMAFCSDGTTTVRSLPSCDFHPCPAGACRVDTQLCSDGSVVERDPNNNCEFPPCANELEEGECPDGINPRETKLCPDLSIVTRSGPNCEFELCPP